MHHVCLRGHIREWPEPVIQTQSFLFTYAACNFCAYGAFIDAIADVACFEVAARATDFGSLWERANGCRWVGWQLQMGWLQRSTLDIGAFELPHGWRDGSHGCLHFRAMYKWRVC